MSEDNTQELNIETPISPKSPPEYPGTPLDNGLTDEELSLAEEAINKEYEEDVRLNFVQYFALRHPHTYDDFLCIRDLCRYVGFGLHTTWKFGRQCSLSIESLKLIFGQTAKFIYHITDDDLEHFRQQLLKHYNITFCRCGCTALMMEVDKLSKFRIGWDKFREDASIAICEGQNITGPINRACRRKMRTIQYLRELEQREAAMGAANVLDLSKDKLNIANSNDGTTVKTISNAEVCNNNQPSPARETKTQSTQTEVESMECINDNATSNFVIDSQVIVD